MTRMNLDAGEHADEPEALWQEFDLLAIACGGHAGDEESMARVVAFCRRSAAARRPAIGAHPSYPDREGFGRRSIAMAPAAVAEVVREQCAALAAVATRFGGVVEAVKPHGALYHDAAANEAIARAVVEAARAALGEELVVIGPPHGTLRDAAQQCGLAYAREGFADRALREDGSLIPRSEPGALITNPAAAAAQARALVGAVDTICLHADTPNAPAIARAVRAALAVG